MVYPYNRVSHGYKYEREVIPYNAMQELPGDNRYKNKMENGRQWGGCTQ